VSTRAHTFSAVPLLARGQFDAAAEHLERALALASRPGFGDEVPLIMALAGRAALHRTQGRFDAAADDLEHAWAAAERLERAEELAEVGLELSRLCAARGDDGAAEEHARRALATAGAHGFGLHCARANIALARALRKRDPAAARAVLDEAIAAVRASGALADLAEALLLQAALLGKGQDAARARSEGEALRRRLGIVT
jgi:tetratricopeptide (TPR) repeat protein